MFLKTYQWGEEKKRRPRARALAYPEITRGARSKYLEEAGYRGRLSRSGLAAAGVCRRKRTGASRSGLDPGYLLKLRKR